MYKNKDGKNRQKLVEQFSKFIEELLISKTFFIMEYDKNNPSVSPDSYIFF